MRPVPLALVLAILFLSLGCVGRGTPTATTPSQNSSSSNSTHASSSSYDHKHDENGDIDGGFSRSWPLVVDFAPPAVFHVAFNLTGAQPGAPVTASVTLVLTGPDGKTIKSADLGLNGPSSVTWDLAGTPDASQAGTYKLKADSRSSTPGPAGVPSAGVAAFELHTRVASER